jgi:hypothetical protein
VHFCALFLENVFFSQKYVYFGALFGVLVLGGAPKPWNGHISATNFRFGMNQRTHFIGEGDRLIVLFFMAPRPLIKKLPLVDTKIVPPFLEHRPTKYGVPLSAPAITNGRMAIRDDFAPGLNLFGPFCPVLPLLQDSTAQRKWKKWAVDKLHVRPYKVASRAFVG